MLQTYLTYGQIISAVLLVGAILLQQRGTGITSLLGGSSLEYSTKRGAEKVIFYATIIFAVLFVGASVARILLS
ncbi:MAG: preprotein translocase subunit SecG [Candidatus Yanofskybacteria bacterium]|nr:preprotein translocase subunit SecG [Candidatus Yanofskybacteria bacterium]